MFGLSWLLLESEISYQICSYYTSICKLVEDTVLWHFLILSITFPFQLVKFVDTIYIFIVNSKHFDARHFGTLILVTTDSMGLNAWGAVTFWYAQETVWQLNTVLLHVTAGSHPEWWVQFTSCFSILPHAYLYQVALVLQVLWMKGSIDHVMTDLVTPLFGEEYKLSGSSSCSFLQL